MKKYLIESFDLDTQKWSKVSDTDPAYQMTVRRVRRWIIWHREIGIIDNLRDAEDEAELRAVQLARGLARLGKSRVTCVTRLASGTTSEVVAEFEQSWYGRLIHRN